MKKYVFLLLLLSFGIASAQYRDTFAIDKASLKPSGYSDYIILLPGYEATFRHDNHWLVRKVLNETKLIERVLTRVVESREQEGKELVRVTRDYYSMDSTTKDVYYFARLTKKYSKGKFVDSIGSWQSGQNSARFGLWMPGNAIAGDQFLEQYVPRVVSDRADIVILSDTVKVPVGTFENCLRLVETSPIDIDKRDRKWFAPGFDLIKWNDLELVKIKRPAEVNVQKAQPEEIKEKEKEPGWGY